MPKEDLEKIEASIENAQWRTAGIVGMLVGHIWIGIALFLVPFVFRFAESFMVRRLGKAAAQ